MDIPSRLREGQRGLRACSLAAAGWAPHRRCPPPNPSRKREGRIAATPVRRSSPRLFEPQRELVGLAANRRVEDVRGARVVGVGVEVVFGVEHEARLGQRIDRSEEHTSELQSLMRISYAVFCLKKNK